MAGRRTWTRVWSRATRARSDSVSRPEHRDRVILRPPVPLLLVSAALVSALTGCAGDGSEDPSASARFAGPGPHLVGVTQVDMGDRKVEVWYPGERGSEEGLSRATHAAADFLPDAMLATLPPELKNITVEMPAYRDIPVSSSGPFPVMTFSHGAGGFRLACSNLLAGIASHGFVVASIDHLEWGLLTHLGSPPGTPRDPRELVLAVLDRLRAERARPGSLLQGVADVTRVATAGHSAGARAAFTVGDRPEVKAMIGYAPVGAGSDMSGKPVLLVVGALDALAGPLEHLYEQLPPTKRLVVVRNAGHNSFADQCVILHGGTNVVEMARDAGLPLPDDLVELALDGCRRDDLPPAEFWRVVQHFTVAHLRAAFGIDDPPIGLGPGVARALGRSGVVYRTQG